MFPAMSWAILFAASLAALASVIKTPLAQAAPPAIFGYLDVAIIVAGCLLTLRVAQRWLRQPRLPAATLPADSEPFPLELLALPILVFLLTSFVAYLLLKRLLPAPPSSGEGEPAVDYASLFTTHVAMIAGSIVGYVGLKFARALRPGAKLQAWRDVVIPLLAALALCQLGVHLIRLVILAVDPDHQFPVHDVLEALMRPDRPPRLAPAMWIGVTIIAPIAEELFFRGILLTFLFRSTRRPLTSLLLGGLVFGLAHLGQPQEVIPLALFGCILGALYLRTRSLTAPIIVHALFNAKTMLWLALGAAV
jgi:membrane protease YdiL (CAAX protease family)